MDFSPLDLLALLIVISGTTLQATIGIGYGLVAAPLLYLIEPAYVPAPILISSLLLSVLIILREHRNLQWARVIPATLARLPGAYLGSWLLISTSQSLLSILFGCCLLLAVLVSWKNFNLRATPTSLGVGGFVSGLMGTATSVGGPPIALMYQNEDRLRARNELTAFFLIGTPISIAMLYLQGAITDHSLVLSVKMLPGIVIGWALSLILIGRIKAGSAKPALLAVSLISAVVILAKGLSGLLG